MPPIVIIIAIIISLCVATNKCTSNDNILQSPIEKVKDIVEIIPPISPFIQWAKWATSILSESIADVDKNYIDNGIIKFKEDIWNPQASANEHPEIKSVDDVELFFNILTEDRNQCKSNVLKEIEKKKRIFNDVAIYELIISCLHNKGYSRNDESFRKITTEAFKQNR